MLDLEHSCLGDTKGTKFHQEKRVFNLVLLGVLGDLVVRHL